MAPHARLRTLCLRTPLALSTTSTSIHSGQHNARTLLPSHASSQPAHGMTVAPQVVLGGRTGERPPHRLRIATSPWSTASRTTRTDVPVMVQSEHRSAASSARRSWYSRAMCLDAWPCATGRPCCRGAQRLWCMRLYVHTCRQIGCVMSAWWC